VRESVMHKNTSRKWKYLGFVLQPAKRAAKNNAVVIALKSRTNILLVGRGRKPFG